jgi:hypothetical protein
LLISGEQTTRGKHRDTWTVADYATLRRIPRSSMNQLATFLTSLAGVPGAAPNADFTPDSAPAAASTLALAATPNEGSDRR